MTMTLTMLIDAQAMSVPNREYVARQVDALETILRIAQRAKTDSKLLKPITGIIGCLFKESEEVDSVESAVGIRYIFLPVFRRNV